MVKNKRVKSEISCYNFFPKNRRGWIKVLEVFVALLMITSVSLIVLNKGYSEKADTSKAIYKTEIYILRGIEIDEQFREDILKVQNVPVEFENFSEDLNATIYEGIPNYLECRAKICAVNKICETSVPSEKDIYAQSVVITANSEIFNPRVLKIFCWEK